MTALSPNVIFQALIGLSSLGIFLIVIFQAIFEGIKSMIRSFTGK